MTSIRKLITHIEPSKLPPRLALITALSLCFFVGMDPYLRKNRNRHPTRDCRMRPSPSVKRCTNLIRVFLATSLINRDVL